MLIIEDIINNEPYEYKKIEDPYVEPTLKDAGTIENESNEKIDNFLKAASEFNKIDVAATILDRKKLIIMKNYLKTYRK